MLTLRRSPIRRKRSKPRKGPPRDKKYLAWLHQFPCVVCWSKSESWVGTQLSPTEAARVGDRGIGQKCSDYEALPICAYHHRLGTYSHHRAGKHFWLIHNLDRDKLIEHYNELYAGVSGHGETAPVALQRADDYRTAGSDNAALRAGRTTDGVSTDEITSVQAGKHTAGSTPARQHQPVAEFGHTENNAG